MAVDLTDKTSIENPSDLPKIDEEFLAGVIQIWEPNSSPYIGGGYSSAKVGKSVNYSEILAESLNENIFFAGEATSTTACATAHSALNTGFRAAKEVSDYLTTF